MLKETNGFWIISNRYWTNKERYVKLDQGRILPVRESQTTTRTRNTISMFAFIVFRIQSDCKTINQLKILHLRWNHSYQPTNNFNWAISYQLNKILTSTSIDLKVFPTYHQCHNRKFLCLRNQIYHFKIDITKAAIPVTGLDQQEKKKFNQQQIHFKQKSKMMNRQMSERDHHRAHTQDRIHFQQQNFMESKLVDHIR